MVIPGFFLMSRSLPRGARGSTCSREEEAIEVAGKRHRERKTGSGRDGRRIDRDGK